MTSEPANLLIAGLCLLSLVLAGGFTQTLVTQHSELQFEVQRSSYECPPDRFIRPCGNWNSSGNVWQVQLIEPVLQDLFIVNGSSSSSPTEQQSQSTGTATSSTPGTAETKTAATQNTDAADGAGAPTSPEITEPAATNRPEAGLDLVGGFDWLLGPALAMLVGLLVVGIALGLRRSVVESPRDLLDVLAFVPNTILSLLIRATTSAVDRLQKVWAELLTWTRTHARPRPVVPADGIRGWLVAIRGFCLGIAALLTALIAGLRRRAEEDQVGTRNGRTNRLVNHPPQPEDDEFDIRAAWRWLTHRTVGPAATGRTPDDIARAAVDRGFPRSAVVDLLETFRDVTYGERLPTDDRLRAAREAYENLRAADRPPGGE